VCVHDCVLLSMGHVPDNKLIGLDWNIVQLDIICTDSD